MGEHSHGVDAADVLPVVETRYSDSALARMALLSPQEIALMDALARDIEQSKKDLRRAIRRLPRSARTLRTMRARLAKK